MNYKKVLGSIVGVLAVTLTLAGCGSNSAKQQATKDYKYGSVTIPAKDGSICNAPNYIAYEKGFFKKNGLKANLVANPRDISDLEAGFASGKYDAQNGDFQYLPAIQNGAQIKAAGGIHQGCIKLLVPKNSNIKSVKDLKGKTIGIPAQGSTPQYVTSIALQHAGLDPKKDVTWKVFSTDLLAKAAQKGEVDAIGTVDPYAYQAQKQDGFKTIVDNNNDNGNNAMAKMGMKKKGSCCYLYLSNKLIQSNSKKAKAIVKSYQEAAAWINKHPEETAKIELNKGYVSKTKFINVANVSQIIKDEHFNLNLTKGKSDLNYYISQLKQAGYLKKDTKNAQLLKQAYWNPKLGN
ncbi:MAG: ABC transporter substrate-binding protein [Lentilactobacillus hilgardii]|jgi:NitT/TauT family transport system substrate-binding protein|uniref:ABC transporter substrate-binding protein n=1 Tax=Lentilactobacillus hilgardii TaxID=1588 RepID=UPI001CC1DDBA|nr:ABC transporter substrate-binding protein [Lentilactobacillus hilgardii]MBZ2202041.1 ABC transporter [Lentilactobacillus hilgardii]MBZ2204845.1 ABC transporter substrate-binding protein [Lentilactobacillus hilgardii]MCI2018042.1 ABC transporter substrate-binding protein [Lentilactobacillus buchneri]